MVKSIKNLPRDFSELVLPGTECHCSKKAEKILKAIGKTPKKVLQKLRRDSLDPSRFSFDHVTAEWFWNNNAKHDKEYVTVVDSNTVPPLAINYEEAICPFLREYLDYDAFKHLDQLFNEVLKLIGYDVHHTYHSKTFTLMRKYFLSNYEETNQIKIRIDDVRDYLSKRLKEQKFKDEYERTQYMIALHSDEEFMSVVEKAMYIDGEK